MSFTMMRSVLATAATSGHPLFFKTSVVRASSSVIVSHPSSRLFSNLPPSHGLPIAQHNPSSVVQSVAQATSTNASQLPASSGLFTPQTPAATTLFQPYQGAAPFSTSASPAASAVATAGTNVNAGPQKGTEDNHNDNQDEQFSWIDKVCYTLFKSKTPVQSLSYLVFSSMSFFKIFILTLCPFYVW